MQIRSRGYKVVYDTEAIALEETSSDARQEFSAAFASARGPIMRCDIPGESRCPVRGRSAFRTGRTKCSAGWRRSRLPERLSPPYLSYPIRSSSCVKSAR